MTVVLVTGAAGGVGSAVAERFSNGGWRVVGTDRPGTRATTDAWIPADLLDIEAIREMVAQAAATHGRLDCVVNAAGLWTEGPSEATSEDEWDRVVGVNLKGLYFVTAAAIPHLKDAQGCVVNVSSDAGVQGNAGAAVYCASKGGVSNLTRALAVEHAKLNIRHMAIAPGWVETAMAREGMETRLPQILADIPLGRMASPEDCAAAIAFLLRDETEYMSGIVIDINGASYLR